MDIALRVCFKGLVLLEGWDKLLDEGGSASGSYILIDDCIPKTAVLNAVAGTAFQAVLLEVELGIEHVLNHASEAHKRRVWDGKVGNVV